MPFNFSEIVKIIDLEPCELPSSESLKFRIEIIRNSDHSFHARIYRHETFRVQPTFPQSNGKPISKNQGDHAIFVLDDFLGGQDFKSVSVTGVLKKVEKAIGRLFAK